ncbi:hypothetical protein [Phenylobacterium sp.]|uniref:hypothetical protein n=1 Tax=Phenylobacterium sp. TaxID=1871053 RepID=UPI003001E2C2
MTRLTTQMEGVLPDLAHLSRDMASIQRALSNLTTDRASRLVELPATRGRRKPE